MKFYVGINMLKGLKIGLEKLDLKIHQLPIQQLEVEHTAKSLGITEANLRKKTQKARNIYKVFVRIGTNKIKRVKSYSADAISNLSSTQIQSIIDRLST